MDFESLGEIRARGTGREGNELPIPRDAGPMPSPEFGPVFAPFPPLMKMPSGPWPPPPPALLPPAPLPEEVPPGLLGWDPCGEIETRAERFPEGIAGGAAGAGVAERAIRVSASPVRP